MGLLSFFKRSANGARAAGAPDDAHTLETARLRARRRLIGAVVLLGIGVIAFPLLFETQPRPIPVDIAIEIPKREGAPPLAVPPAPPASKAAAADTAAPPQARHDAAQPKVVEARAEPKPPAAPPAPIEAKAEPKSEPRAEPRPAARAPEPAASRPAAAPTGEGGGRFVVQVGAFADTASARSARSKVEQLGLRTYTQTVETDAGKRTRVRLGPFASRDEADRAAAKVKAAGLPAAVLTL